eukprot:s1_g2250.t1
MAIGVVPNGKDAKTLWGGDFPFQVVADHPGFLWRHVENRERMPVGFFFWFAEPVFTLDLNMIKTVFESEPRDLWALGLRSAIRDQGKFDAQIFQTVDGFQCAWKRFQFFLTIVRKPVSQFVNEIRIRAICAEPAGPGQTLADDLPAGIFQAQAPFFMMRLSAGPEFQREGADGIYRLFQR